MLTEPIRVLLDTGIFSHSEFAVGAVQEKHVRWGNQNVVANIHGYMRKPPDSNPEYQQQKEALFTVGRLIRQGRVKAYEYIEIKFELMRGSAAPHICNALTGCIFHQCPPALDRSKFRKTTNLVDYISKGGKKDAKRRVNLGSANQIAFIAWLNGLKREHVGLLIQHAAEIGFTPFEIDSLNDIEWFQFLCTRCGTPESYPDAFHLWTAKRNGLDAFITLETRLPNLIANLNKEKQARFSVKPNVYRPLEILRMFGVKKPDPVPMEPNRFIHFHELN